MSLKQGIGSAEFLKKRIPKNAKYQHIRTRLDTGCSFSKYMERLEEIKRNYRYRNNELFKRLKVTTFAQLILQVASVSDLNSSVNECDSNGAEDVMSEADLESPSERSNRSHSSLSSERQDAEDATHTARSTLLSVISGVGELNMEQNSPEPVSSLDSCERLYPDCPYLLLDVRDRDQYDRCHIITAHSFPITSLSRTMNPYTTEVLEYKNAAGKIIIVYDEDERTASQAATTMCERGFENLFMLSGGLKVVAQKFPGSFVTGSLPPQCLSPSDSVKGKRCAAPLQTLETRAERRWRFTSDELYRIQDQLDEVLIPSNTSSRMSSRVSSVSCQSKASRSRQSSCMTTARDSARVQSSRPWK